MFMVTDNGDNHYDCNYNCDYDCGYDCDCQTARKFVDKLLTITIAIKITIMIGTRIGTESTYRYGLVEAIIHNNAFLFWSVKFVLLSATKELLLLLLLASGVLATDRFSLAGCCWVQYSKLYLGE